MTRAQKMDDVAVIGGGVIGLAIAWRLAERGATVTVHDDPHRRAAAHVAAGMLTPASEACWGEDTLMALNLAAMKRWPEFGAELEARADLEIGLRLDGVLSIGYDADDVRVIDDIRVLQDQHGLENERLVASQCRTYDPLLAPSVRGGSFVKHEGAVDPRLLLVALRRAAIAAGAQIIDSCATVQGLEGSAGKVVVAAGAWSGAPVRPVFGEVLRLGQSNRDLLPAHVIRAIVKGEHVYIVPRIDSGEIIVGATSLDLGFRDRPTAGGTYALLRDAMLLVPGLSEADLLEVDAGLRPGSPDNAPIVGWSNPHVFLASGHNRNGILLAPVTADAVADAVVGPGVPALFAFCAPDRFATERYSPESLTCS